MIIDFLGLQDVEVKGYEATLTYLSGKVIRYTFQNEAEREEFKLTMESFIKSIADIYSFNPN